MKSNTEDSSATDLLTGADAADGGITGTSLFLQSLVRSNTPLNIRGVVTAPSLADGNTVLAKTQRVSVPNCMQMDITAPSLWPLRKDVLPDVNQRTVIHAHTAGPMGLLLRGLAEQLQAPFTATFHTDLRVSVAALLKQYNCDPVIESQVLDRLTEYLRDFYQMCRLVVGRSQVSVNELAELVARQKLFPLEPGVEPIYLADFDHETKRRIRAEMGLQQRSVVATFVGRINQEKGADKLLKALMQFPQMPVRSNRPEVPTEFMMVGEVDHAVKQLFDEARLRLQEAGIPFHHYEQLAPERLAEGLGCSAVNIGTYQNETLGMVPLQAAGLGVASVVPKENPCPSIYEIDRTRNSGFHLQGNTAEVWAKSLRALMSSPGTLLLEGDECRKSMRGRSVEKMFGDFITAQEDVRLAAGEFEPPRKTTAELRGELAQIAKLALEGMDIAPDDPFFASRNIIAQLADRHVAS